MPRQRGEVGAIDVGNVDAPPPAQQPRDAAAKVIGVRRERGSVDRTRRRPADHRERSRPVLAENRRDRAQRAGLVRGARATAGQHETGRRGLDHARSVRSRIISIAAVAPQMYRSPYGIAQ